MRLKSKLIGASAIVVMAFMGANVGQAALVGYRNAVLADNPFLYYEFEETSGTTANDSAPIGGANNGTYTGPVVLGGTEVGAQAGLANAVKFAASGTFVDVPNLGGNHTKLTLEAWINVDGIAAGCCTSLYSTDAFSNTAAGKSLHFNVKNTRDLEHALAGGGPNNINSAANLIQNNTWYHIVSTFDGTTGQTIMYLNGLVVANAFRATGSINLSDGQIGAWAGTRFLPGHVDEFALYDSVLTPAQVLAHFNAAAIPEPATAALGLLGLGSLMLRRRRMA